MWQIIWNGNTAHVEEHGLTVEDVEHVLAHPAAETTSRTSGLPCCFGRTPEGVYIIVVYEQVDRWTIYPVTAYEVDEPMRRSGWQNGLHGSRLPRRRASESTATQLGAR